MKLPISRRLRLCAEMVPETDTVADVGADHGYLGIYLLLQGKARHVIASDIRRMPIEKARENACRFGVSDCMDFFCAAGLAAVFPGMRML